jgi:hypothetical protein
MAPPLLQLDLPGGPLLYLVGLVTLLSLALPAYYVYNDATNRNNENARLWTVATILGGLAGSGIWETIAGALLVVVLYLILSEG